MKTITKEQARDYLVRYHFLDERLPKSEIDRVFSRLQTIQFDPLNVVARNADLVLNARIESYHPNDLERWLYRERYLVDGWDKMMNIYRTSDREAMTPILRRYGNGLEERGRELLGDLFEDRITQVRARLRAGERLRNIQLTKESGTLSSGGYSNYSVLEYLLHRGEAEIERKESGHKIYRHAQSLPVRPTDDDFFDAYTLRRIRSVGLIRPNRSDAWLGYYIYDKTIREAAIRRLLEQDAIAEVAVEGVKGHFLLPKEEIKAIDSTNPITTNLRFLAPLDNILWDRKLIEDVFDFFYRWEVYVPKIKRQWGYYVLPILHGSELIGRIEPLRKKDGGLEIRNIWWEEGATIPTDLLEQELTSFDRFLRESPSD